jgi:hypothetical protein
MIDTNLVYLTQELTERFYGKRPARTIVGIAAVQEKIVLGIAGFYRNDTKLIVFTELNDDIDKRTIVKGIRLMLKLIKKTKFQVYSYADHSIKNADILLLHVGFRHVGEGVYKWQC